MHDQNHIKFSNVMSVSISKKFVGYQKDFARERIKNVFSNLSRGNTTLRCGKHVVLELWVELTLWKANARVLLIKGPYTAPPPISTVPQP